MNNSLLSINSPLRILYVEDNEDDAYIFNYVLKKIYSTCEIIWLKDGQELYDYLYFKNEYIERKENQATHLIIMDINMPKIDGLKALEYIQFSQNKELLKVPVIMLSTSAREEDVKRSKILGTVDYIIKPHFYEDLVTVITNLMQEHLVLKPAPITLI